MTKAPAGLCSPALGRKAWVVAVSAAPPPESQAHPPSTPVPNQHLESSQGPGVWSTKQRATVMVESYVPHGFGLLHFLPTPLLSPCQALQSVPAVPALLCSPSAPPRPHYPGSALRRMRLLSFLPPHWLPLLEVGNNFFLKSLMIISLGSLLSVA